MKAVAKSRISWRMAFAILLSASFFTCRIGVDEPSDGGSSSGIPTPANGAVNVAVNPTLAWTFPALAGRTGILYDVYIGITNPPTTALVRDYANTSYATSNLTPGATYYWRVDYLDGSALTTGTVWRFTVTTAVNRAPVFTGLRDTAIDEGQQLRLVLSAPDPDGDSVAYSMAVGPQGTTLTGNNFTWTPNFSQSGVHQVRFIARDNGLPQLNDTATIAVTVRNVSAPPVLQQPRDTTVNEGQTLRITLSASDPDGNTLVYFMRNAPSGATLTGSQFTWTPDTNQAGTYIIDFVVTEQTVDSLRDTATVRVTVRDMAPTPNLIGYWDFNEGAGVTLTDRSGNGNNGTISGATWVNGVDRGALNFNGVDNYCSIPNSTQFNVNAITVMAWMKAPVQTGRTRVVAKSDGSNTGSDRSFEIQIIPSNRIYVEIFSGTNGYDTVTSTRSVQANSWNHVGFTANNGTFQIFINGILDASAPYTGGNIRTSNQPITLGKNNNIATNYFNGALDDVRIYSRALTAAEITAEYDKIPPTNGLVAYWPFSGNANDASGNVNNGTVNGATLTADRFGNANSAFAFNGTSGFVKIPYSSSLNLTSAITISAWMKSDTIMTSDMQIINGNSTGDYRLEITNGRPAFTIDNRGSLSAKSVIPANSWHHIVATYNGTASNMFLDGIVDTTSGNIGSMSLNAAGLWIGSRGTAGFFKGTLDEIRIYNRVLTPAEIQTLFN